MLMIRLSQQLMVPCLANDGDEVLGAIYSTEKSHTPNR